MGSFAVSVFASATSISHWIVPRCAAAHQANAVGGLRDDATMTALLTLSQVYAFTKTASIS